MHGIVAHVHTHEYAQSFFFHHTISTSPPGDESPVFSLLAQMVIAQLINSKSPLIPIFSASFSEFLFNMSTYKVLFITNNRKNRKRRLLTCMTISLPNSTGGFRFLFYSTVFNLRRTSQWIWLGLINRAFYLCVPLPAKVEFAICFYLTLIYAPRYYLVTIFKLKELPGEARQLPCYVFNVSSDK